MGEKYAYVGLLACVGLANILVGLGISDRTMIVLGGVVIVVSLSSIFIPTRFGGLGQPAPFWVICLAITLGGLSFVCVVVLVFHNLRIL